MLLKLRNPFEDRFGDKLLIAIEKSKLCELLIKFCKYFSVKHLLPLSNTYARCLRSELSKKTRILDSVQELSFDMRIWATTGTRWQLNSVPHILRRAKLIKN